MKTNSLSILAAGATLIIAAALGSCNSGSSADEAAFAVDSIGVTDSVTTEAGSNAVCRMTVLYPTAGPAQAVDSIRFWIADAISSTIFSEASEPNPFKVDSALINDGRALITATVRKALEIAKIDLDDFDSMGLAQEMTYSYDRAVDTLSTTARYVSYMAVVYDYTGGAHGATFAVPEVFSLADGHRLGWSIFKEDGLSKLATMVEAGIMAQYFRMTDPEEFKENLLIETTTFPLPVSSPYLMPDGVHFIYQQYEIAPYSAGMPECVIPYSDLYDLMTPEGIEMVK